METPTFEEVWNYIMKKESEKYRRTLLRDADKIEITWRFDEQQADPIHRNNFVENLKKELEQSLKDDERI